MVDNSMDQLSPDDFDSDASRAVGDEDSVDLGALFQTLRHGRKTILGVSLIACAIATAIAFTLPPRYTSVVSFIPPNLNGNTSLASAVGGQLSALGASDLLGGMKSPGELYAAILKSRSIASDLIKRFDLMHVFKVNRESQAETILAADTTIAADAKSSIVTVGVTSNSPELARSLANGYMDALRMTNGRLALGQSSQRRLFFGQQLEREKNDLEAAEVELKQTEEQSGLISPVGQTAAEIKTLADTQAQIAAREVTLAALHDSATEQNPEVIRLRSEISNLQNQLLRLQRGDGGNSSTIAIPTTKVPEVQLDYVRKEREVKYHEALFEMLSRQYEAARLDEARDAPVLQVLDPASYPDTKSSPKRTLYMFGGLVLGFLGSSIWVLKRPRIHGSDTGPVVRQAA